ncbi:hypothetical protein FOA43_004721 [Brettanomyces nanus]|uniref:Major facilitator superfamily (MFS) profile domain-containing protein n=1 Tax=Eeniella nana TaxID=13502 RepID=A0A875SCB1_EENNA|nr:uncharacterized protein FOA43_004721 [Brettanomyces nanus]QPG77312.1 hypothetical protein FOA43_004721 [Brettanomyces nanus]
MSAIQVIREFSESSKGPEAYDEITTVGKDSSENEAADDVFDMDFSWPSVRDYIKTRFTDLFPSKEMLKANRKMLNPIPGLMLMGRKQWLMFFSAFLGWTWVAYDFFTISLNIKNLSVEFDKTVTEITWGITTVLMLRTAGSLVFGYLGDRYGRKWPLVINLLLVSILQIGTGFVKTYDQFLGVRAVFGILLGGVYGNATATALDDCPTEARGFISGFLQQGYTFGYLMAVIFNRAIAANTSKGWRANYWFGSGVMFLIVIFRCLLPETDSFRRSKEIEKYNQEHGIHQKSFKQKAAAACKTHWLIMIYLVFFAAAFNFMSHGSQDLYPTLLTVQYNFSEDRSTVTNCVANIGALCGGITVGHLSNFVGRRLSIIICCIAGGALIYPWAFVSGSGINAGAFFLQFCVQGAWGSVPVHLSELAPAEFRAFVVGLAYQLGNLASSASSTIETSIGENFPITLPDSKPGYNYAKVMAIFVGCVFAYTVFIVFVGPERRNVSLQADQEEIIQAERKDFGVDP